MDQNSASHRSSLRGRRRRLIVGAAAVVLLVSGSMAYSRWGWLLHSLMESTPSPPWRMPTQPIKVMSFNIHTGDNLDSALKVILAESPDVACLQEIRPSQMSKIERTLGMEGYWRPSSNLIGDAAWGNAILVRGKLGETQALTTADGKSYGVWGAADVKDGRFVVASVHLMHFKSRNGGIPQRVREASALTDAIKSIDAPAVVASDFNVPPFASFIQAGILEIMQDATAECGATLPSRRPWVRVDYIYCSNDWAHGESRTISSTVSDHRPVVGVLSPRPVTTTSCPSP